MLYFLEIMVTTQLTYSYGKEEIVHYFQPYDSVESENRITKMEELKRKYDLAIQGRSWTFDLD